MCIALLKMQRCLLSKTRDTCTLTFYLEFNLLGNKLYESNCVISFMKQIGLYSRLFLVIMIETFVYIWKELTRQWAEIAGPTIDWDHRGPSIEKLGFHSTDLNKNYKISAYFAWHIIRSETYNAARYERTLSTSFISSVYQYGLTLKNCGPTAQNWTASISMRSKEKC